MRRTRGRWAAGAALTVVFAAGLAMTTASAAPLAAHAAAAFVPPPIGHVWVIELENKGFGQAFTDSPGNTYIAKTLPSEGELLTKYYGTGHASLDNYISETSGESPNLYSQADCQSFIDVIPGTADPLAPGQVIGQGCVYPSSVKNIANQLTEHGDTWHGYMEDLGNNPTRDNTSATNPTCGAPVLQTDPSRVTSGKITIESPADPTQTASATDQYAARHNPFAYFHSLIDVPAGQKVSPCQANVGPLVNPKTHVNELAQALKSIKTTPTYSFITPNLCDDAHDSTCVGTNLSGSKDSEVAHQGGIVAADYFLEKYVPEITSSPAFKKNGLLIITIDESGDGTDTSCCGEQTGPNTPAPGEGGSGGGLIGTVLLSPYITPGSTSAVPYDHYAMLRSLEDELHLTATSDIPGSDGLGHLGYAGQAGLVTFHQDVFPEKGGPSSYAPPATGSSSGSTTSTTSTASAASSGKSDLAFTGERAAVPIAGAVLVVAAGGIALANRRRRGR